MIHKNLAPLLFLTTVAALASCNKLDDLNNNPETTSLQQGFQSSAAIGYCASLASAAFNGEPLPDNVTFESRTQDGYSSSGILYVHVTKDSPLPYNKHIGDIIIAGLWNGNSGVISIIFGDMDVITSDYKFYGLYTVPVTKKLNGDITTVFAEQDIIIGEGSDTLMNLSLSKPKFDTELTRLNANQPTDAFVAIKQNVWFITIDQNNTLSDLYDDAYKINGGGQIVEAKSTSGGILYHAMINTKFSYQNCMFNPTDGTAFIQNLKASNSSVDLGNLTLQFHGKCDGQADVMLATGKYIASNGRNISLNWH